VSRWLQLPTFLTHYNKGMKTLKQDFSSKLPTDYDQLLTLDDIKAWNFFKVIARIIDLKGYYTCTIDNAKTIIIK